MNANHTIEASEKAVHDIFCEKYLFRIPSYQRPYAWTTEQASELLNDISGACGDSGDVAKASPYFLGSIVLIKDPQRPDADVVDGQQRLTTLTILLSVLRDLSGSMIGQAIHKYVCETGDPIAGTPDRRRLTLRERDAEFFQDTVQEFGATATLPEARAFKDSRARIVENAAFLRDRLSGVAPEALKRLTYYIARRCYLVVVAASDQESAFRIFSVLNSRGLDLSPADILKADIIGALPAAEQDDYTEMWEDIEERLGRERFAELFGHIRMIHRKQKMKGNLVAEFREFVPTHRQPKVFIDTELDPYADAYEDILGQSFQAFAHAEAINTNLARLARLDNVDWQPPAIEVIAKCRQQPEKILSFLIDLERLAYGLFLQRNNPTERIRRYGRVLESIQSGADLFSDTSPLQLDAAEKKAVLTTLSGDIYTFVRVRLPLLLRLDEMLSAGNVAYGSTTVTVEHVLPQNPAAGSQWLHEFPDEGVREQWVHRLANLVLLTSRKNSQAGNLDFAAKKAKYFSTKAGIANFALTSSVLASSEWTLETLEGRQKALLDEIAAHWRLK